jgi:hypothetical protein
LEGVCSTSNFWKLRMRICRARRDDSVLLESRSIGEGGLTHCG